MPFSLLRVRNNHVHVHLAIMCSSSSPSTQTDNKATVFVSNIQHNMNEENLRNLFEKVHVHCIYMYMYIYMYVYKMVQKY